ncbi:hypothetical protein C4R89_15850 [Clostridioides difficile]|nr:hypothetical protein [Clostridioides difficile]MDB0440978.1 hypothetical protein [Clostridioides difficile]
MDEEYLKEYLFYYEELKGKKNKEEKIRNYNLINIEKRNIENNRTIVDLNVKNNMLIWFYPALTLFIAIDSLAIQVLEKTSFSILITIIVLLLMMYLLQKNGKELKNLSKEIEEEKNKREKEYQRIKELSILECVYKDLLLEEDRFVIK